MVISKNMIIAFIIIGVLLGAHGLMTYTKLSTLQECADKAWTKMDTLLQQRLDIVPDLVATVQKHLELKGMGEQKKQYGPAPAPSNAMEEATEQLGEVYNYALRMRAKIDETEIGMKRYADAQVKLNNAIYNYIRTADKTTPDIKRVKAFHDILKRLSDTEKALTTDNYGYTEDIRAYNAAIQKYPDKIWAIIFTFKPMDECNTSSKDNIEDITKEEVPES